MDQDAAVGKLIREYSGNGRKIICLQMTMKETAAELAEVANALNSDPSRIQQVNSNGDINVAGKNVAWDVLAIALGIVEEWSNASSERVQMETNLRGMKLEEFIRPVGEGKG